MDELKELTLRISDIEEILLDINDQNELSQDEVEFLSKKIESFNPKDGEKGEKGDNGKDGRDGKDGLNGKDGLDGKNGIDGKDGVDGVDGIDGSPDTPEDIVSKLNTLDDKLEWKVLKDFKSLVNQDTLKTALQTLENQTRYLIQKTSATTGVTWGSITGTLSNQTDLQATLDTKASKSQFDFISGTISAPLNQDYKLVIKIPYACTITETTTISVSGTCTATFKINTTALGGTANSVSSSEQSQAHASANSVSAGDDIVVTISANTACIGMAFTIQLTRTLA